MLTAKVPVDPGTSNVVNVAAWADRPMAQLKAPIETDLVSFALSFGQIAIDCCCMRSSPTCTRRRNHDIDIHVNSHPKRKNADDHCQPSSSTGFMGKRASAAGKR